MARLLAQLLPLDCYGSIVMARLLRLDCYNRPRSLYMSFLFLSELIQLPFVVFRPKVSFF
jgi:hypothetical protein